MQIQAIHSLNFCFSFHSFYFNYGDLYCTQITLYIFFVEIIFENEKNLLFSNLFRPKMNLKHLKNMLQD